MDNEVEMRPYALICGDWYNAALIAGELTARDWDVVCVDSIEEADHLLRYNDYDLIIVEWSLPYFCGNRTVHHIRAELGITDIPVLVISEGIRIEVEQKLRTYGHIGFMHIPFCTLDFDCFKGWHHHQTLPQRRAA